MIRKTTTAIAISLTLAALGVALLTGSTSAAHRRYTIVLPTYIPGVVTGGQAEAKRLGMRYILAPFNPPPQVVVRFYKSMIARHVDTIVGSGYDPGLKPILTRARKAGILLISSGDDIAAKRDLWVNYSGSVAFAHALADALASQIHGKGEYAILGEQGQYPIANTWEKIVQAYVPRTYPKMKLDGVLTETGSGGQDEVDSVKSFMAAHPNLNGLSGIAPTEAYIAAQAITQAGRIGQVFSAGNAGTDLKGTPVVGYLRSGAMVDVIAGNPIKLGYLTVWAAHYLLTGHHFTPQAYQVGRPIGIVYYYAKHQELRLGPPLTITKKNLAQYANKF